MENDPQKLDEFVTGIIDQERELQNCLLGNIVSEGA
jgi:hypothetical protein